jgi:DNA-binding CsgD family transcriptional regulator
VDIIDRALTVIGDDPRANDLRLLMMMNAAGGLQNLGRPVDADRAIGRALILAEQTAAPPRLAYLRVAAAGLHFDWGRWDEALAELQAVEELPLDANYRLLARGARALIAIHRDDREAADAQLHGVEDLQHASGDLRICAEYILGAWALAAERDGEPAQALTRLLAMVDPHGTRQFGELTTDSWVWLLNVVRLAMTGGETDTATGAARACVADADRQARLATTAAAQHCQGLVARDPAQVHAAADTFHRIGYAPFQAQALEDAAHLYAEHGDATGARIAYLAAVSLYTDLDAVWDLIRADARLRPYNIRRGRRGPRRRPATGWEALTPTEHKIAHLVAEGQSNPDIAAQMFLSRRTVETHVSHILAKLNANSRIDVAREVSRR